MKTNYLFLISALFFSVILVSCIEKSPVGDSTKKNAVEIVSVDTLYTFDITPHIINDKETSILINNFRDSIRFKIDGRYLRTNFIEGKVINVNNSFWKVFPRDSIDNRQGIRVHIGLNMDNRSLEYYLSPVKFALQINFGLDGIDTLYFAPEDTAEISDKFEYLESTSVYKVVEGGELKKIDYQSDKWDEMIREWKNYKRAFSSGNVSTNSNRGFNRKSTRSMVIPNQILHAMIDSNQLSEFNVISCAKILETEREVRHSVLFSYNYLTEEEVNQLIKNDAVNSVINKYSAIWSDGKDNKFLKPKRIIKEYKDLSVQELIILNLELGKGKAFYGLSANYSQLCPTRCGRLLGNFDPQTRLFTIKGFSK